MNYQVITLILDYIVINNFNLYFQKKYIKNLRHTSKEFNSCIKQNNLYNRKKASYLLTKTFIDLHLNIKNIKCMINDSKDLKYVFNVLNIYGGYGRDPGYEYYSKSLSFYKDDPLNPLKTLRLFTQLNYQTSMKNSIYLNLALSHADKPPYYLRLKEIEEYSAITEY
jgi:hypothetical protein